MVLRVRVGKSVLNLVSVYAPQVGRSMEEKEEFFISLGTVLSAISDGEHLVVCGDMNGHVGKEVNGFEGVHGGYSFGSRNVEGEMPVRVRRCNGFGGCKYVVQEGRRKTCYIRIRRV